MAIATEERKTVNRRGLAKIDLPSSAEVLTLSGNEYLIVPLDDFTEWEEDRMLAAIMAERMESDEELIPLEEVERRLDAKKKKRS